MSEDGFHVHGPHDHALEHGGEHHDEGHSDPFASRIAVATAVLATIGAVFSLLGGASQNDALLFKNDAAIKKTEASDQWNLFQAKSNKQNLAELGVSLTQGDVQEHYRSAQEQYKKEKEEIKKTADDLDRQSEAFNVQSERSMHAHHYWAIATTALQISIAMAAMALLTRKRWLGIAMYAAAGIGVALAATAFLTG